MVRNLWQRKGSGQWIDLARRFEFFRLLPSLPEFVLGVAPPIRPPSPERAAEASTEDGERFDVDDGPVLSVFGVEVAAS